MNQNQQDFEKLFRTELESVNFELSKHEIDTLSPIWSGVLNVSSLYSLDCDVSILEQITDSICIEEPLSLNLFTASFLLNAITKVTPKQLDITVYEYIRYCQMTKEISSRWNELVIPIRTKLMNKLQTQAALQGPKNGMSVIPGRGR